MLPPDYFDLVDICIILCLRFGDKIFGRRKNEPDKNNDVVVEKMMKYIIVLPAIKNKTDDWYIFTLDAQTYIRYNYKYRT